MHRRALEELGSGVVSVRSAGDLDQIDGLVIPGGESSVIARFISMEKMADAIRHFSVDRPIWGTCAGMILMARRITNDDSLGLLNLLDIAVERNGYGRQYESFVGNGVLRIGGREHKTEMVFIRAPKASSLGNGVSVLGKWQNEVTAVQQGKAMATSFHPELSRSRVLHRHFLSLV
jgi:5'-phosphate synthase pdxT subunit